MSLTIHAAEDLVAAIQDGRIEADPAVVSQALECLDQVARWVNAFEAHGALPPNAGDEGRAMAEKLRSHLARHAGGARPASGERELPDWAARLIEAAARPHRPAERGTAARSPFPISRMRGASSTVTIRSRCCGGSQICWRFAYRSRRRSAACSPSSILLPAICVCYAIAAGPRDALSAIFRLVPDQVRIIDVPAAGVAEEHARPGITPDRDDDTATLVRAVVAEQREMLRVAGESDDACGPRRRRGPRRRERVAPWPGGTVGRSGRGAQARLRLRSRTRRRCSPFSARRWISLPRRQARERAPTWPPRRRRRRTEAKARQAAGCASRRPGSTRWSTWRANSSC